MPPRPHAAAVAQSLRIHRPVLTVSARDPCCTYCLYTFVCLFCVVCVRVYTIDIAFISIHNAQEVPSPQIAKSANRRAGRGVTGVRRER